MLTELAIEYWTTRPAVDATTVGFLAPQNFAYKLLGLTSVLTQNAAGAATVLQYMTIVDGQSNPILAFAMDGGNAAGAANGTIITTWQTAGINTITPVLSDGGVFIQNPCIPADLWILPQWQISLHYQGVTAGGYSGGDVWEYVTQHIARRP